MFAKTYVYLRRKVASKLLIVGLTDSFLHLNDSLVYLPPHRPGHIYHQGRTGAQMFKKVRIERFCRSNFITIKIN